MSLLVLGSVALDTVKTPFAGRERMLGGSAVHFSASARLFSRVAISAVIGSDFPDKYIKFLKDKKLILSSLISAEGKTFHWEGGYKKDLNAAVTLNTELGVFYNFRPVILERQKKIKHIFLANLDPETQSYLLRQMACPKLVGLDSMNYWIEHKKKELLRVLKKVDIYLANDEEARSLSGERDLSAAARSLCCLGPKMVVVKRGSSGCLFYTKDFSFLLPAYRVRSVVDPTGAGDTFAGGFIGYLSGVKKINKRSIQKALAYGTVAASFNVEGFGLERSGRLTLKALNRRLKQFQERQGGKYA